MSMSASTAAPSPSFLGVISRKSCKKPPMPRSESNTPLPRRLPSPARRRRRFCCRRCAGFRRASISPSLHLEGAPVRDGLRVWRQAASSKTQPSTPFTHSLAQFRSPGRQVLVAPARRPLSTCCQTRHQASKTCARFRYYGQAIAQCRFIEFIICHVPAPRQHRYKSRPR